MKSCGVVVEYNPFHNGHLYHIQEAKNVSDADVIIAVMSGNFLQRGEPAIIDKFHRTKAALSSGVDLVLELPYAYAVQHSDYFAKGAVNILRAIGVQSICFGSESGDVELFKTAYRKYKENKHTYEHELKNSLERGLSFPEASSHAYEKIGLTDHALDLSQPNNILGFGYVKAILENDVPLEIHTIKRLKNDFHDQEISGSIASATSIRKELIKYDEMTPDAQRAIPDSTYEQLLTYKRKTGLWHDWELYFPFVHYLVQTMTYEELQNIHGMVEGLEYRLKQTAKTVESMEEWMDAMKTKRYTRTRIQRLFTHILTNTKKVQMENFLTGLNTIPYIRILGMNRTGQNYLNQTKKNIDVPLISGMKRDMHPLFQMEERASLAYYSVLMPKIRKVMAAQELTPPLRLQ